MKFFHIFIASATALFAILSSFLVQGKNSLLGSPNAGDIVFQEDIAYGSHSKQKLDLCKPASLNGKIPGVILIHGGGGDKSQHTAQCKSLARNGFVAISVNYREDPPPTWKVVIADNRTALDWLRSHENVDPARIGAVGGSQGGYVASLMGAVDDIDKAECVNNNFGPTDLTDPSEWEDSELYDEAVEKFFGGVTYEENPALYRQLSPITHVTSGNAENWLFTRSTNDNLVPRTQMTKMIDTLNSVGIQTEFYEYEGSGGGHANKLGPLKARKLYNKKINFMTNCLNNL